MGELTFYATIALQIGLIVHVIRTGRERVWIFVLLFLPLVGALAYLVIELLPEFRGSVTGQRAARGLRRAVDPGGSTRQARVAWERSPNADNARRYAGALIEAGEPAQALDVLDAALTGLFSDEPNLLLLRARAQFDLERPADAAATLEALRRANPDFRSAEGHLLYARALEGAGRREDAIDEYREVASYYPGAEARYRYGAALAAAGRETEANQEFAQMLRDAELAPAHFRRSQKRWLDAVRKAVS